LLTEARLRRPRLRDFYYLGHLTTAAAVERILAASFERDSERIVCDVGCGGGAWRHKLEPYASHWIGLDLERWPAVTLQASAEAIPLADASIDLVFSTSALEHVRDYRAAIAEIHRVLRPGGTVLLGTHGSWEVHGAPHDYWRWTPPGLLESFAAFAERRVEPACGPTCNYLLLQNLHLRRARPRLPRPLRGLCDVAIVLNNLVGRWFGEQGGRAATLPFFHYVVARK